MLASTDITEALAELGYGKPEAGPSPERIRARAAEIVREQGYDMKDGISPDVWLDAVKVALRELSAEELAQIASRAGFTKGKAPEPKLSTERERALAEIRDGIAELQNHSRTGRWGNRSVQAVEPPEREGVIFATPEMRRAFAEFSSKSGGHVIGPTEEGLRLHLEAEKRLRAAGKVGEFGKLDYTVEDYVRAYEEIEADEKRATGEART